MYNENMTELSDNIIFKRVSDYGSLTLNQVKEYKPRKIKFLPNFISTCKKVYHKLAVKVLVKQLESAQSNKIEAMTSGVSDATIGYYNNKIDEVTSKLEEHNNAINSIAGNAERLEQMEDLRNKYAAGESVIEPAPVIPTIQPQPVVAPIPTVEPVKVEPVESVQVAPTPVEEEKPVEVVPPVVEEVVEPIAEEVVEPVQETVEPENEKTTVIPETVNTQEQPKKDTTDKVDSADKLAAMLNEYMIYTHESDAKVFELKRNVESYKLSLAALEKSNDKADNQFIAILKNKISNNEKLIDGLTNRRKDNEAIVQKNILQFVGKKDAEITHLNKNLEAQRNINNNLLAQNEDLRNNQEQHMDLQIQNAQKDEKINSLMAENKAKDEKINSLTNDNNSLASQLAQANNMIATLNQTLEKSNAHIKQQDEKINAMSQQWASMQSMFANMMAPQTSGQEAGVQKIK